MSAGDASTVVARRAFANRGDPRRLVAPVQCDSRAGTRRRNARGAPAFSQSDNQAGRVCCVSRWLLRKARGDAGAPGCGAALWALGWVGSGCGGRELVSVELSEVVGGGDQAPFR